MAGTEAGVTLGQPHLSRQDLTTLVRREFGVGRARHLRGAVFQRLPYAIFCPVLEGWVMVGNSENLPRLACLLPFCSYQRVVRMGRKGFMTVGKKSPKCSHASFSLHTTMLLHLVRKYKAIMPGRVTSYPYKLVPAKET